MKKTLSLVLALMLSLALCAGGLAEGNLADKTGEEGTIYGFLLSQTGSEPNTWSDPLTWVSFNSDSPEETNEIGQMPNALTVFAADIVGDTIYGYSDNNEFFTMSFEDFEKGYVEPQVHVCNVTSIAGWLYIVALSYDCTTDIMYALVWDMSDFSDLLRVYEVDMQTGDLIGVEIEYSSSGGVADISGGFSLIPANEENTAGMVYCFAINADGEAYIIDSAKRDGVFLYSLDLETGVYEQMFNLGANCFQNHSMTFDRNTGKLYWAQFNTFYNNEPNGLYEIDVDAQTIDLCGVIGIGSEVAGMFIPWGSQDIDPILGDANGDGVVNTGDVSAMLRHFLGMGDINAELADVNGDGTVNTGDAACLLETLLET